jgi:peptide deformylase
MPNPVLRETAERVDKREFGPELRTFCERMIAFMKASKGVGLAAPQIGLLKRILRFGDRLRR